MWIYSLYFINLILLGWYTRLFLKYRSAWMAIPSASPSRHEKHSLTLVIAVRNEEASLPRLFECLANQKEQAETEFLFVDDHSSDHSLALLKNWAGDRPNVYTISLPHDKMGKKAAMETGIRAAKGRYVLCSDADTNQGAEWIANMRRFATETNAVFVSGPVSITPGKTWFSRWQSLEFAGLISIGAAAIFQRRPNMCNGANLLFLREAFFEVNGYQGNENIASGDDQFLMHKLFDRYPDRVFFCKSREAIVYTSPKETVADFVRQRIRWASKNGRYTRSEVSREMVATWFLCFLLILETALAFYEPILWSLVAATFLIKMAVEYFFYRSVLPFFDGQKLLSHFWISEIVQVIYVFTIGWMAKFVSFEWKGRKYE